MIVNATEFKNKVGKYLEIANGEDVIITRNGKQVVKIVKIDKEGTPITDSLIGVLKHAENMDLNQERNERLKKHESVT